MKESTLLTLVTAKTLFETAWGLCNSANNHLATSGLIILQDALELIFMALLVEKGVDEEINISALSFEQVIGELTAAEVKVIKSGTLKALNKHRVLAKHYGQLVAPETVKGYLNAAQIAIDNALQQVINKNLNEVYLIDLLDTGESLEHLKQATINLENLNYLQALIDIRKALFVEIEHEYSIYMYRDNAVGEPPRGLLFMMFGMKAPAHTKNSKWILENVKTPTDYIQIDSETMRMDALEWGINNAELQNLLRLTPKVFRVDSKSMWHHLYSFNFEANEADKDNVRYCLDKAISVILKKQQHKKVTRYERYEKHSEIQPFYIGQPVFKTATKEGEIVLIVSDNYTYRFTEQLVGFDGNTFYRVSCVTNEDDETIPKTYVSGYLAVTS